MLCDPAKKTIGFWKLVSLRLRRFLSPETRNEIADSWQHEAHELVTKAKNLSDAAMLMDPRINSTFSTTSAAEDEFDSYDV